MDINGHIMQLQEIIYVFVSRRMCCAANAVYTALNAVGKALAMLEVDCRVHPAATSTSLPSNRSHTAPSSVWRQLLLRAFGCCPPHMGVAKPTQQYTLLLLCLHCCCHAPVGPSH
jgi:hypothetical protein